MFATSDVAFQHMERTVPGEHIMQGCRHDFESGGLSYYIEYNARKAHVQNLTMPTDT